MEGPERLPSEQLRALDRLRNEPAFEGLCLVGGTAIAAHLGHRRSLDLDLFSHGGAIDLESVRRRLVELGASIVSIDANVLRAVLDNVRIDVVRYPYAAIEAPAPGPAGFPTLGLSDLAAMKLAAIARRGLRRDFWDLHEIARRAVPLEDIARLYRAKFGSSENDLYQAARALTYFADADAEPLLPAGLTAERWAEIKRFFFEHAGRLVRPRP